MKDAFSHLIIGKAMEVHRELGPGLDEYFYHALLAERLREANVAFESKPRRELIHRGILADTFESDLVFPNQLVAELKVLHGDFAPEHYVQLNCYLKFWGLTTGLLFDFAKNSLLFRRVNFTAAAAMPSPLSAWRTELPALRAAAPIHAAAEAVGQAMSAVLATHGLGYRDTTYRGLLLADLKADGIPCLPAPVVPVRVGSRQLGETACPCLVVQEQVGVLVLALRDTLTATDRATLQTYLRLLGLPLGVVVNFGKSEFTHRWVIPSGSNLCLP